MKPTLPMLFCAFVLSVACSESRQLSPEDGGGDSANDAGITPTDARRDVAVDARPFEDAGPAFDAQFDSQAMVDAATDANAMVDAEMDATLDADIDAEMDATVDADIDAETDATLDADTGFDANADADAGQPDSSTGTLTAAEREAAYCSVVERCDLSTGEGECSEIAAQVISPTYMQLEQFCPSAVGLFDAFLSCAARSSSCPEDGQLCPSEMAAVQSTVASCSMGPMPMEPNEF